MDISWYEERLRAIAKGIKSGKSDEQAQAAFIQLGAVVLHDLHRIADGLGPRVATRDEGRLLRDAPGQPTNVRPNPPR